MRTLAKRTLPGPNRSIAMPIKGLWTPDITLVNENGNEVAALLIPRSRLIGRNKTENPMK